MRKRGSIKIEGRQGDLLRFSSYRCVWERKVILKKWVTELNRLDKEYIVIIYPIVDENKIKQDGTNGVDRIKKATRKTMEVSPVSGKVVFNRTKLLT